MFPFSITNNSHLFKIRGVEWSCQFLHVRFENGLVLTDSGGVMGSTVIIDEGKTINFNCPINNPIGPKLLEPIQEVGIQGQ
jgi:hypothetical protein